MHASLEDYLPGVPHTCAEGSSAFWLIMPTTINTESLSRLSAQKNVLIEPGGMHFTTESSPSHFARLGFAAIELNRIASGIKILSETMAEIA